MEIDLEEHYDKVYRYCYFKLHNEHLAEDITQETFLRFFESSSYEDAGRPLAYLYTVARNLCIDEYRKKPTVELDEEIEQAGFEETIAAGVDLKRAMEGLSKEEQELLLLRYVNEVPLPVLEKMYQKSRFALYRDIKKVTKKLERRISNGS